MEAPSPERQQIIARLVAQQPDNIADAAISHWEKLAGEIVSVVGEAGFASLYDRSLYLSQATFPWLAADAPPQQSAPPGDRFVELRTCLASQAAADACAAHSQLLNTFTDILASLIGEQLTSNILRAAWNDMATDTSGKELDNE
ncbi:hypothetical protein [Kineobactrum salinum]|uniref:Uncharacterized protein n=1 Tax=Kineobactrum salinum TaxID=2708301 RepID=A0A6C0U4H2_9GAMM|nr:hypothetical protein [Kineobactrum salinum]QIB66906.1 hypothetical protein G3T16_17425 [Kineobactrum salinum]